MSKKKRTYNPQLIKSKRSYSIKEISRIFDVHIRTVQKWVKEGLVPIANSKPFLFQGGDIRLFLKKRKQKHRRKLEIDEFYCTKCHSPRKSVPGKLTYDITHKTLGMKYKHAIIKGVCETCGGHLFKFSSDRIITKMKKRGWFLENIAKDYMVTNIAS